MKYRGSGPAGNYPFPRQAGISVFFMEIEEILTAKDAVVHFGYTRNPF
jgi:hypothetical protein